MAYPELTVDTYHRWLQEYRSVYIEVAFWGKPDKPGFYLNTSIPKGMNNGNGMWNYYLTLVEDMFEPINFDKIWLPVGDIDDKGRVWYNYDVWPFVELGLHGGATYYSKRGGIDDSKRSVKVGCDYGHAWDQDIGYPFSKTTVWYDACRSVDRLHELIPNLKRRCIYNGHYYPSDQGSELVPGGAWQSFEGQEASRKWKEEHNA